MIAAEVMQQNDGDVTKAYYEALGRKGYRGQLAVALFRAQKRSSAAKRYRPGKYRHAAYDVKSWSIDQVCAVMNSFDFGVSWGWKRHDDTPGFPWVLYIDLPTGQCSFHSRAKGEGPIYAGEWIPADGSTAAILRFCDFVWGHTSTPEPAPERQDQPQQLGMELGL